MDKTPAQIAEEAWYDCEGQFVAKMAYVAAAVIVHVRPQIKAAARAAAVEECLAAATDLNLHFSQLVEKFRAIAAAPAGFVCVPVEPDMSRERRLLVRFGDLVYYGSRHPKCGQSLLEQEAKANSLSAENERPRELVRSYRLGALPSGDGS